MAPSYPDWSSSMQVGRKWNIELCNAAFVFAKAHLQINDVSI